MGTNRRFQHFNIVYVTFERIFFAIRNCFSIRINLPQIFAPCKARHLAAPLTGTWQSSQRAELTAALHAMEAHESGPLLIRTDSAWTMAGAIVLAEGYAPDLIPESCNPQT